MRSSCAGCMQYGGCRYRANRVQETEKAARYHTFYKIRCHREVKNIKYMTCSTIMTRERSLDDGLTEETDAGPASGVQMGNLTLGPEFATARAFLRFLQNPLDPSLATCACVPSPSYLTTADDVSRINANCLFWAPFFFSNWGHPRYLTARMMNRRKRGSAPRRFRRAFRFINLVCPCNHKIIDYHYHLIKINLQYII